MDCGRKNPSNSTPTSLETSPCSWLVIERRYVLASATICRRGKGLRGEKTICLRDDEPGKNNNNSCGGSEMCGSVNRSQNTGDGEKKLTASHLSVFVADGWCRSVRGRFDAGRWWCSCSRGFEDEEEPASSLWWWWWCGANDDDDPVAASKVGGGDPAIPLKRGWTQACCRSSMIRCISCFISFPLRVLVYCIFRLRFQESKGCFCFASEIRSSRKINLYRPGWDF